METNLLNTISLPEMTDLIRRQFVTHSEKVAPTVNQLFIMEPIGKGQGKSKRYTEIDTQTFARGKREAEKSKKASVGVGYSVDMIKKRVAMEIDITQEMRDENRYSEVGTLITSLVHFCPQRMELDGSHVLGFSGATSYVDMDGDSVDVAVGDGLSLINAAHTLKFSSLTFSNRVASDPVIGKAGLEAAEKLTKTSILSHFGERRVMRFNAIITSDDPNTCNIVRQLLGSGAEVGQDNSNVMNLYKGKYTHIELPYLATDANGNRDSAKEKYWFLASIGQGQMGWQAYLGMWEAPRFKEAPTNETGANHDYSADVWTFGVRAGYAYRAVSPRGIIGSFDT